MSLNIIHNVVQTLQVVKLTVVVLFRRDSNLRTADCGLRFMLKTLLQSQPKQQKIREMNEAHFNLDSPIIMGELGYAHRPQLDPKFIALLGTKFGQWRNPHWSIPVNEQVALWTEQVALPSKQLEMLGYNFYRNINQITLYK